jgi:hypothetical protein
MRPKFDSPAAFLKYVQKQYSQPLHRERSNERFNAITNRSLKHLAKSFSDEDLRDFKPVMNQLIYYNLLGCFFS